MYVPTSDDISFARFVTRVIADGGVWGFPSAGLVYRFDRAEKVIRLIFPKEELDEHQKEMHERGRAVFGAIGWVFKP